MDHETVSTSESRQSVCPGGSGEDMARMKAKDVMQYGVISIDRKEPVSKAVCLLLDKGISGLPVTDQGRLSGMVTEKDLLKLISKTEYLPGLVEEYMTPNVVSFDVEDPLHLVCEHLIEGPFRRAPVLYQQRLAGMISRGDLIRAFKQRFGPQKTVSAPTAPVHVLAEDVMRHGLLTAQPSTSLYEAMDMIARHHITGLPVVDPVMFLVGIVTEKDALQCVTHPTPAGVTVESIMTTEVIAFDRKARLDEICACLIENDFHRVPILDHGRLVGIVTRSDILRKRAAVLRLGVGRRENASAGRSAHTAS
jgi:CBS domain-containing protein